MTGHGLALLIPLQDHEPSTGDFRRRPKTAAGVAREPLALGGRVLGEPAPWPLFRKTAFQALERFPIRWNHLIEKESLRFKELEHVLIEKVDQLFRNML
jgi:hypothetical protein